MAQNHSDPSKHSEKHHLKETALDALHRIEDTTADAYHTIEDHDAKELQQDVKGILAQLADWSKLKTTVFKTWYLAQPLYLQIAYGLTLVPVVVVLAFIVLLLVKFGGPILLAIVLVIKLSIVVFKTVFFIGYILYKILKTIIMWYYILTRLYFGRKAKNRRFVMAECGEFTVEPASANVQISCSCRRKNLYIRHLEWGQISVLFSYLRYALVGHLELFKDLKANWRHYLTIWRQETRSQFKAAVAPLGDSLFGPHKLGAHINDERLLVPGDAELLKITINNDQTAQLSFRIGWVNWHFKLRKALKFLQVSREHCEAIWDVQALFKPEIDATETVTSTSTLANSTKSV